MKIWQRRAIGILTIGGGSIGLATVFSILVTKTHPIEWLFCSLFIALYLWGIWCGIRLLERQVDSERAALKYWLFQVPTFGSPFIGYFFSSGFHFTVSLQFVPTNINFNFFVGSTFNYSLMQTGNPWFIGINLFALAIVLLLAQAHRQINQHLNEYQV